MTGFLLRTDDVLRRRPWTTQSVGATSALLRLAANLVVFGMVYGAVLGSFGGISGERFRQVVYAALKVPLLLLATFLIGLPSFFVLNTLLGLRRDFGQAVRALVATQAGLAIVLASLAPVTAFWYASSADYAAAVRFNVLTFSVASLAAQALLRGYYRPLIERTGKHRAMLWTWLFIYAFVGIQMGWILRPFVGDPHAPVQFLREGAWGNAYVVVAELICRAFAR
ncbi:MAG: hypothetical protein JXB62_19005 [Pirellulales bacterium]|nr:hypothetical protein [Pirellulales bacterium]